MQVQLRKQQQIRCVIRIVSCDQACTSVQIRVYLCLLTNITSHIWTCCHLYIALNMTQLTEKTQALQHMDTGKYLHNQLGIQGVTGPRQDADPHQAMGLMLTRPSHSTTTRRNKEQCCCGSLEQTLEEMSMPRPAERSFKTLKASSSVRSSPR